MFIWTLGDIIGLAIFAVVFLIFAGALLICFAETAWDKITSLFKKKPKA